MARDGLLPPFFSTLHPVTAVPVSSALITGLVAALMAFSMSVDQLSGMVSVGTLSAFKMVAVSLLILRYVPPPEVSKAVIVQVPPDKGPPPLSVHISPSRPVFAKGSAIFSPILSILRMHPCKHCLAIMDLKMIVHHQQAAVALFYSRMRWMMSQR
jgi:cationic amino acid transporter 1